MVIFYYNILIVLSIACLVVDDYTHQEPVTKITWIKSQEDENYQVPSLFIKRS